MKKNLVGNNSGLALFQSLIVGSLVALASYAIITMVNRAEKQNAQSRMALNVSTIHEFAQYLLSDNEGCRNTFFPANPLGVFNEEEIKHFLTNSNDMEFSFHVPADSAGKIGIRQPDKGISGLPPTIIKYREPFPHSSDPHSVIPETMRLHGKRNNPGDLPTWTFQLEVKKKIIGSNPSKYVSHARVFPLEFRINNSGKVVCYSNLSGSYDQRLKESMSLLCQTLDAEPGNDGINLLCNDFPRIRNRDAVLCDAAKGTGDANNCHPVVDQVEHYVRNIVDNWYHGLSDGMKEKYCKNHYRGTWNASNNTCSYKTKKYCREEAERVVGQPVMGCDLNIGWDDLSEYNCALSGGTYSKMCWQEDEDNQCPEFFMEEYGEAMQQMRDDNWNCGSFAPPYACYNSGMFKVVEGHDKTAVINDDLSIGHETSTLLSGKQGNTIYQKCP